MTTTPVTDRNSEVGSSDFHDPHAERETGPDEAQTRKSALTDRDMWADLARRALAYITPPSVLTGHPDTVAQLAAYAKAGAWTRRRSGVIRALGVWWYRLVGLPYTVTCRYAEWIAQRPGRAIPVLLLVKLLASTTPGAWVVEHVIVPIGHAAAWLFL